MTIRAFYSRGGFSIQDPPIQVINNVGNYNGGTGTFSGAVTAPSFIGSIAASSITGTTLASNVVLSSLTSLGTITSGVWNGTVIGDTYISSAATWNTASTDRLKWDGGATGLVAATGRTSLGLVIGTNVQAYSATLTTAAGGTYTGNVTGNVSGSSGSCTGNAATATNVPYTGLTGTVPTWNQSTTGNAATVTNGAYTNIDNNFSATQTFQADVSLTGNIEIGIPAIFAVNNTSGEITIGNKGGSYASFVNDAIFNGANFQRDITVNTMTVGLGNGYNNGNSVAIGTGALLECTDGIYNTAIGSGTLGVLTVGGENSAFGFGALAALVDGSENIAIGKAALGSLESGSTNTAIGKSAMFDAVDAEGNVAIGGSVLQANVSGVYNVAIGESCLTSGECTGNVANGRSALQNTTGNYNVALGYQAGRYRGTSTLTLNTATESIFIGNTARASASAMTREIVIGSNAVGLGSNTTVIGVSTTLGNRIFGVASTGQVAPTVASATTIAPTKTITFISGTTAIATITAPSLIASTGGQITLIPTGIFTTTTAGNIALASTAVVSKALIMTYDATTTKWYPSY